MLKRGLIFAIGLFLASCSGEDKTVAPVVSSFELKKSNFAALSGWENDDFYLFGKALKDVCDALQKMRQESLKSDIWEYTLDSYRRHCDKMVQIKDSNLLKVYISRNFEPYAVIVNGSSDGKFTSYYEANLRASFTQGGEYQYPIYGKPRDLIEINLRDFDADLPNRRLVGRIQNGKLVKYYTRQEIDRGLPDAPVILWGDDPVDIYIMQIQGSAVAVLPDGKEIRVGYADNNGHKFRGIGSILLEKGLIKQGEASMPKIRRWLQKNGDKAKSSMLLNDRYIFHKIVNADGPIGAMGLPLVVGRSMAVDKSYIPLGTMMWLETFGPDGEVLNRAVMAEDIGGAIKGGIRGDYFWGHGEDALQHAGRMNSKGRYFVLLPKGTEVKINGR